MFCNIKDKLFLLSHKIFVETIVIFLHGQGLFRFAVVLNGDGTAEKKLPQTDQTVCGSVVRLGEINGFAIVPTPFLRDRCRHLRLSDTILLPFGCFFRLRDRARNT